MAVGGSKRGAVKRWAAKSRTGCSTCKQRRIKCDERQPRCRRCEIRDEKCGYEDLNYIPISEWSPLSSSSAKGSPGSDSGELERDVLDPPQQPITQLTAAASSEGRSKFYRIKHSSFSSIDDEQFIWASWFEHAGSMVRSHIGVTYLFSCLPRVAWSYKPAFNALKAFIIVLESVKRKDDEAVFTKHRKESLIYANKSIQGLVHGDCPPEVFLIVTTIFWMYEAMVGNWKASESHLNHGWSISRQTQDHQLSEPFIAYFVATVAGAFPRTVNAKCLLSMTDEEQQKHHEDRKRHAQHFMTHALRRLRQFQRTVEEQEGVLIARTFPGVADAERQLCSIIASWATPAAIPRSERNAIDKIIKSQSPFIPVLQHLDRFLEDNDEAHLLQFESIFRPTLDQFMWLAATDNLKTRQRMIEIQYQGRRPARLANRQLKIYDPV